MKDRLGLDNVVMRLSAPIYINIEI